MLAMTALQHAAPQCSLAHMLGPFREDANESDMDGSVVAAVGLIASQLRSPSGAP